MCYDSIYNCPINIFFAVSKSEDTALLWYGKKKLKKEQCDKAWDNIYNQLLKENGLPESYKQYIEHKKKAIKLFWETFNGQPWKMPIAEHALHEAYGYLGKEETKLPDVIAQMSKKVGFRVPIDITVAEYFAYLKM